MLCSRHYFLNLTQYKLKIIYFINRKPTTFLQNNFFPPLYYYQRIFQRISNQLSLQTFLKNQKT